MTPGLIHLGAGTHSGGYQRRFISGLIMGGLITYVVRRQRLWGMLIESIGINETSLAVGWYQLSGSACCGLSGYPASAPRWLVWSWLPTSRELMPTMRAYGWSLMPFLAVVIGGNSLLGGRFSIIASLLGALIIQSVNSVILLSGMPPEFNLVIKALLIIVILFIQSPAVQHAIYLFRASTLRPMRPVRMAPKNNQDRQGESVMMKSPRLPLYMTMATFVLAYMLCIPGNSPACSPAGL